MQLQINKKMLTITFLFLLTAVCFVVLAVLVSNQGVTNFDSSVSSYVQEFESATLTKTAETLSLIGGTTVNFIFSLLIVVALLFLLKNRMNTALFIVGVGGSVVLNKLLKVLFARERPTFHPLIEETGFSFPSGHAMGSMALYGILIAILWNYLPNRMARILLVLICVFMIASIGLSRVYLGVHYPSDVIAGYLVSFSWICLSVASITVFRNALEFRRVRAMR